jgi:ferrochelatase
VPRTAERLQTDRRKVVETGCGQKRLPDQPLRLLDSPEHNAVEILIVVHNAIVYDALCLLSFGGPNGPDDVMPFLRNVTTGRNVPDERLAVVAKQYEQFGGRSPINDQNEALIDALRCEFDSVGIELPIYFGNRNWEPYLADTVAQMRDDGVANALVLATSAFSSYSGCRQYREDLAKASEAVGDDAPGLHKLRLYYNHPGFIDAVIARIEEVHRPGARLVFTAHSIPLSMAQWCDYQTQLDEMAGLVADSVGAKWDIAFQSRSGPPQMPWLEPDVNDHLRSLAEQGITDVTLMPLGFISDHMEVQFDLDFQAAETAATVGIDMRRAATVGTHAAFVTGLRQLVEEKISDGPVLCVGNAGPWPDPCPEGHCLAPPGSEPVGRPSRPS